MMQIKDLIRILKTHDEDDEVKCLALVEGADFTLELEGVGGIEGDETVYIYAKVEYEE